MPVYFAPMEGLTDAVFRRVHHEMFTGVAAYMIPFISPTQNLVLNGREKHNVLPEHNRRIPCIPQVLTKEAEHFLWAAETLAEMGYTEVNLNAGCPSGTVTAKGKGAGILKDPVRLDAFLEKICKRSPLPISVKTRIGFETPEEWERLLEIYCRYPISSLIVHPRACRERYDPDQLHRELLEETVRRFPGKVIVNGDLFSRNDPEEISDQYGTDSVMLGRGLVANPALARIIAGGEPLRKEEVIRFHDRLEEEMSKEYSPDIVFMKLRVVMKHLACCFAETGKLEKKIRKSRNLRELLETDRTLFEQCELKKDPCFVPDERRNGEV